MHSNNASECDYRLPVRADDLDAVALKLAGGGAAHVTDAVGVAVLAEIHEAADAALGRWDGLAAEQRLPVELAAPFERRFVPLDHLPIAREKLDALVHPTFRELARRYLKQEPKLEPNSHVRAIRLDRADAHLPFHQDETILERRLMNVWIPLDPCGIDAPGLEVVWRSSRELLKPSPLAGARFPVEHARLDPAAVLRRYGAHALWRPQFRPGDAMLFTGTTVHRTHVDAAMTAARMSVEIRLV